MISATAVVDRNALRHNLRRIHEMAPGSRAISVVKANAYGHGLLEVAHTLPESDCFGVARIEEALTLRAGGVIKPILLMEGFFCAEDLPMLAVNNIETVVHSVEQLTALETARLECPIRVWMKIDTGMHRLGVRPEQAEVFYQRLCACKNVVQPVNIMTHFSRADEHEADTTHQQIKCFDAFAGNKPGLQSLSASGGILLWPEAHRDWVRPGIILYGVSPLPDSVGEDFGLKAAMTLKASLIAVREHQAGEPVGYGGAWISDRDTRIGVIAIGYGDGYPRDAPNGTPVLINGRRVPLVGHVSMDMITVDLGADATDKVGDEAIIWGEGLPVETIAEYTGIIPYELITKLTARVANKYIG